MLWCAFPSWGISEKALQELSEQHDVFLDPMVFPESPGELVSHIDRLLNRSRATLRKILAVPLQEVRFENTVSALDALLGTVYSTLQSIDYIPAAQNDTPLAEAARAQKRRLGKWVEDVFQNKLLSERVALVRPHITHGTRQARVLDLMEAYFQIPSPHLKTTLDSWERKGLYAGLEELTDTFVENVYPKEKLLLSKAQLAGVPESLLGAFPTKDDSYEIDPSLSAHTDAVLRYCSSESTRRLVYTATYLGASEENERRAAFITAARRRIAQRDGYSSWLEVALSDAVLTPKSLISQLNKLARMTEAGFATEKRWMRKHLKREPKLWDVKYCRQKYIESLGLDENSAREYLPLDRVIERSFRYFGELFDLRFERVEDAAVWDPKVQIWAVLDKQTSKPLFKMALDLFHRPNKEPGFFCHPMAGSLRHQGLHVRPSVTVHTAYPETSDGSPVLLSIEDLWSFFHELGHALHMGLSQQPFWVLGLDNAPDLAEMPSIFLERLAWEPEVLSTIGSHYKTDAPMPAEMVRAVALSRTAMIAHSLRDRIVDTVLDAQMHSSKSRPMHRLEREVYAKYLYPLPKEARAIASYQFLTGYDGTFNAYLIGEAGAQQMLSQLRKAPRGLWDTLEGKRFRKRFFEAGGRWTSKELVQRTLGEPLQFCPALLLSTLNNPG
ncbi:hypothetical protein K2X33_01665 [bacterium]|nr:hypothetical protein [bacterium]